MALILLAVQPANRSVFIFLLSVALSAFTISCIEVHETDKIITALIVLSVVCATKEKKKMPPRQGSAVAATLDDRNFAVMR